MVFFFTRRDLYVQNVLDPPYNADPTGVTDSQPAIQAAVNWTTSPNRGKIYFPLGAYRCNSPVTFNGVSISDPLSICFQGECAGTSIFGSFPGFIFDRSSGTPTNTKGGKFFEGLQVTNADPLGGCIRMGSTLGGHVKGCILSAHTTFTSEDSAGNSSQNISFEDNAFSGAGTVAGSNGVIIGGAGTMRGCDFVSFETAVRFYGDGWFMSGNRSERCNTALMGGLDSAGNPVGASAFALMSGTCEGCWTAIDLGGPGGGLCTGFRIGPYGDLGHDSSNSGVVPFIQGTQYGLRIRADCARGGVISGYGSGNYHDVACIAIENASTRANNIIQNSTATQSGGAGASWVNPTNAQTALFFNNNNQPIWTFAQLPTGGNRLEGDEFDISDSTVAGWSNTVTVGGGTTRVRVRFNGTNWTVVGV